jgi:hypothetical protein
MNNVALEANRKPIEIIEYDYCKGQSNVRETDSKRVYTLQFVKGNTSVYERVTSAIYSRAGKEKWNFMFKHVFRCAKDPDTGTITSVNIRPQEPNVREDTASSADIIIYLSEEGEVSSTLQASSQVVDVNLVENWFREHSNQRITSGTRVGSNLVITNIADAGGVAEYYLKVG